MTEEQAKTKWCPVWIRGEIFTLPTDTIKCWNCDGQMQCFTRDTFNLYYRCLKCGEETFIIVKDDPGEKKP